MNAMFLCCNIVNYVYVNYKKSLGCEHDSLLVLRNVINVVKIIKCFLNQRNPT